MKSAIAYIPREGNLTTASVDSLREARLHKGKVHTSVRLSSQGLLEANALEAAELCQQQLSQPSTKLEPSEICESDRTIGCQKTKHADEIASPLKASSGILKDPQKDKRLAIIVPYRGRADHLSTFTRYMHAYLQQQRVAFRIYVVEQLRSSEAWSHSGSVQPFNRGWLLNQGFLAAERDNFTYVALHDVDMLPVGVDYSYPRHKFAHLAAEASQFRDGSGSDGNRNGTYKRYCGGVFLMDSELFRLINGFGNLYWGWGAEDDDFCLRLIAHVHGSWANAFKSVGADPFCANEIFPCEYDPRGPSPEDLVLHRPQRSTHFLSVSTSHTSRHSDSYQLNQERLAVNKHLMGQFHSDVQFVRDGLHSAGGLEETVHQRIEYETHTLLRVSFPNYLFPMLGGEKE
eukprot:CAMPEP_0198216280 /NCGR_PEP_ID=MMETSP1445-20131203/56322_1 /TAXON_ID=36898 /ORGANISM="Pyramimonas sp., Strain CCMP2087" /LENGTH=401 /DNA_ID=CAMNT_0043892431 /DNA_START=172 /DNA_END=1374 /DNA_ORIENTATION=-